ncbi:MAG: EamA family transporter [Gemmatimonadetes bacterium]|nr:EamA family transporter [Gemmatimonadota bacterium]
MNSSWRGPEYLGYFYNTAMTLTAIILILISAFTHVGWNLLCKREHPSSAFFLLVNTFGTLCLIPALILFGFAIPTFPTSVWLLLVVTGIFQTIYILGLANAYQRGDLSILYPIARSSPVIVVIIVTLLFDRADQVSIQCIWGIALVAVGMFILPMKHLSDFHIDNYLNASVLFALMAAFASAGYSIIDDEALRFLRDTPALPIAGWQATILYAFFEGLITSLWLGIWVLFQKRGRILMWEILKTRASRALQAGTGMAVAYTLVLISLAFVSNVSYAVTFRQISIPLGTVFGILLLKEPGYTPKYLGVAIIFTGLVLVGTG